MTQHSDPVSARAGEATPAALPAPAEGATAIRYPLLTLLRPRHAIKNTFVLAPLIFAGLYADPRAVAAALAAALLFTLAASAVYVFNDLMDAEKDRRHPVKRWTRPIAAGEVSPARARTLLGILAVPLAVAVAVWPTVGGAILLYLAINIAYTIRLKAMPVVDLFCIAAGFVIRVWTGALAVQVPLSSWMLITTLCLALYLATMKRWQELRQNGAEARAVLEGYSVALLERYAQVAATATILFYGLYVLEVQPGLVVTIPLVLFGLFRYAYLAEQGEGESPTDLLWQDLPLVLAVVAWGGLSLLTLGSG
jgi:decaprenyl-phosphate phosphoribosyltransferase